MQTIGFRLSGSEESTNAVLDALRGLPGVDRVEEMGTDTTGTMAGHEDSSSAGLSGDITHSQTRAVEVHAISEATAQQMRDQAEVAARDAGVVVEWLTPF